LIAASITSPALSRQAPAAEGPVAASGYKTAADYSTSLGGHAVLVMLDGKVVFEQYDGGWRADRPHPLASGTKSFAGAVAAAAVEDGLITWDELACETLSQWKGDPLKSKITLRHLLNLSSGLDPSESTLQGSLGMLRLPGQKTSEKAVADDRFAAALDVAMHHAPGTKFEYGPSHYYAFGALLEAKLKARHAADPTKCPDDSYEAYMKRRVLDPIGLTFGLRGDREAAAMWGRDQAGHLNLPGGALLTARDWAKYGEFIRLHGAVTGADGKPRQVIAWETLSECFKPSAANKSYGLTWWLPSRGMSEDDSTQPLQANQPGNLRERLRQRVRAKEFKEDTTLALGKGETPPVVYMAAGLGKQRLFVIPEYGLTVVRYSANSRDGLKFSNLEFIRPILETAKAQRAKASP